MSLATWDSRADGRGRLSPAAGQCTILSRERVAGGRGETEMTHETVPGRVNVGEYAGKQFLLNLDRAERADFYKLLDEAPWEGKTASGHWQVRDLCGHLIDVTEGYLERFALARAGKEAPAALGLLGMAQKLDEG